MGLFSWLFGKRQRVVSRDCVWLTATARLRGAVESVQDDLKAGKSVLVLAHFPDTLDAFRREATSSGWATVSLPNPCTPASLLALAVGPPRVIMGLVRDLRPDDFPPDAPPPSPLPVLALERHFLREHDDRILRFAEGLGSRAKVDYCVSLDDPLLTMFAGEWVRNILRGLGMLEDECLESGMVSRRIAGAQAKLAKTIPSDHEADSPAAWLERNQAT